MVVPTATGCKSSPTRYKMADVDENVADDFVENEAVHELTAVKKRKHRYDVNFKLEAIEYTAENSGEKAAKRFGVDSN